MHVLFRTFKSTKYWQIRLYYGASIKRNYTYSNFYAKYQPWNELQEVGRCPSWACKILNCKHINICICELYQCYVFWLLFGIIWRLCSLVKVSYDTFHNWRKWKLELKHYSAREMCSIMQLPQPLNSGKGQQISPMCNLVKWSRTDFHMMINC